MTKKENVRTKNKYVTLKLPEKVMVLVDKALKESNKGFTSRTDVIKHAIRTLYS